MDQMLKQQRPVPETLQALYAPIGGDLQQIEDLLREELRSDHPFVDQMVKHGFRLGGKRLRPALVLLMAKACGQVVEEHTALGAALELIHTATLIHDDVLDEAKIRRHLDTANARWDNEASVLLGDYLFARSFCLVGAVKDSYAVRELSTAAKAICEGELRQIENRGNYELSEEEYYRIIAGKTAELIALACRLGAYYAGADAKQLAAAQHYGYLLGVSFQIADDVLDLEGDESKVGKSLGTDLIKEKATLPLIRVLSLASEEERKTIKSILTAEGNHHAAALRPWLERFDAVNYAKAKARELAGQAADAVMRLPESEAKTSLIGLTEFVVKREQ